jgi:hypothetical protein
VVLVRVTSWRTPPSSTAKQPIGSPRYLATVAWARAAARRYSKAVSPGGPTRRLERASTTSSVV